MKKIFSVFALMAGVGFFLLAPTASADIAATQHGLVSELSLDFVCQPCHSPHPGATVMDQIALGNRSTYDTVGAVNNTLPAYTPYANPTTAAQVAIAGTSMDALCLSCHDGTLGMDAYGGAVGSPATLDMATIAGDNRAIVALGGTLAGEHPVSIDYDVVYAADSVGYKDPAGISLVKFFADGGSGTMLRCATCHEPHVDDATPFLRAAPAVLCGACHTK